MSEKLNKNLEAKETEKLVDDDKKESKNGKKVKMNQENSFLASKKQQRDKINKELQMENWCIMKKGRKRNERAE